eukprot:5475214-Prymnesium_polylepis.2
MCEAKLSLWSGRARARPSMTIQPKTIKDYQAALVRLGSPLPQGKRTLAQYKELYHAASKRPREGSTDGSPKTKDTKRQKKDAPSPPARAAG